MKIIDLIKPDIYDSFQCKGAACRRTCCAGWKITVSKSEYQDLKEKLKHIETKILHRLPEKERTPHLYGGFVLDKQLGCSLQSEEGLCGLQLSLGMEALPKVCAYFPRKGIRCGNQMQLSLTPACERVLELLMEKDASLGFVREEGSLPRMTVTRFPEKNAEVMWSHYVQLQEFCILLLQAEDVSLDSRMALLGMGLHQIDTYYKTKEEYRVSGYINQFLAALSESDDADKLLSSEQSKPDILLGTLFSYSSSASEYAKVMSTIQKELQITSHIEVMAEKASFTYSPKAYIQRKKAFLEFTNQHPFFLENLMVMLFVMKHWGSSPYAEHSIWEQYMYACWVYSNLKLAMTACMETVSSDEELLDVCVVLLRSWVHNDKPAKAAIKHFHDTGCDTPAHMAMLVQAG